MSKHSVFKTALLTLCGLFILAATFPVGAQPPPDAIPLLSDQAFRPNAERRFRPAKDYFPLRVGDKWTFRVGRESTYVESVATLRVANMNTIDGVDVYCFELRMSPTAEVMKECYSLGEGGIFCHHMRHTDFVPPVLLLKSPILFDTPHSMSTKVGSKDLTFRVTVKEDRVKVPAGDFDAIRVAIDTNIPGYEFEYSLTPHIGFVKMSWTRGSTILDLELLKFETGTQE